jgi:hypothetical protein
MIPVSERTLFYGRFLSLSHLSFWEKQHVGEDEDGALVASY